MVPFESTLERDFLTLVATWPHLKRVEAQPITVSWFDGKRWRRYTPDFRLELDSVPENLAALGYGSVSIVEVKYSADYENERDAITARLKAVTGETGLPAVLADEKFIRSLVVNGGVE